MANKKRKYERQQYEQTRKQRLFKEACDNTKSLHIGSIAICVLTLLLFFTNFAEVYNTNVGVEVKVSGWSFLAAGISGNYSSSESLYGDLAVPFYYYAKSWCETIGLLMPFVVLMTLILLALEIIVILTNKHFLTYISVGFGCVICTFLLVIYINALGMKDGKILSTYCGGNSACSIKSYAIVPFLSTLAHTVLDGFIAVKLLKARQILK